MKILSAMVGVLSRISIAALRPLPSSVRTRRCETIARRLADRSISSWLRRSSGKKLMMRSIVWLALLACSVPRHRWPVSAKAIACSIVSASRISPIRITSGAWRSVFFSAWCQECVSTPTSRCVTSDFLRRVHVLDRVLDRDDVAGRGAVAVVDHRRQRGRLARAGAADDQHQPALGHHDVLQHFGQLAASRSSGSRRRSCASPCRRCCCCTKTLTRKRDTPGQRDREVAFHLARRTRRAASSFISDVRQLRA